MTTYDLVGVGVGPFNLSLAALADGLDDVSAVFLDENTGFSWHPGLLIDGTTLQVPFLADLATLVDPTSRWSFLSYLAAHDRMFPFYFAEDFHISRREYDHYCRWAADSLPSCRFGKRVTAVNWDGDGGVFRVEAQDVQTARVETFAARNVVLGVGTSPVVPEPLRDVVGKEVFHSASYLDRAESLREADDVTVLGSGQSGAEVVLDLLRDREAPGRRVRWLTRSPAFAPMEYSKLGLEHFTPDYTRYFHSLPQETKDRVVPRQWQLYKAGSADTLAAIQHELYERGVGGADPHATLMPNVEVTGAALTGTGDGGCGGQDGLRLQCRHVEQDRSFTVDTDRLVLSTGYSARRPDCMAAMGELIRTDPGGRYRVDEDYRVALDDTVRGAMYVQNAEMHTHGVGAPDLGLGAHRAAVILNSLTGRQAYRLPSRTAFTTFGL